MTTQDPFDEVAASRSLEDDPMQPEPEATFKFNRLDDPTTTASKLDGAVHLTDDDPTTTQLKWDRLTDDDPTTTQLKWDRLTDDDPTTTELKWDRLTDDDPTTLASKVSGPAPRAGRNDIGADRLGPTELEDVRHDPALVDDDIAGVAAVFEPNDEPLVAPAPTAPPTTMATNVAADLPDPPVADVVEPDPIEPLDVEVDLTADAVDLPLDVTPIDATPIDQGLDDGADEEPFDVGD